jgi:hypothetical protein
MRILSPAKQSAERRLSVERESQYPVMRAAISGAAISQEDGFLPGETGEHHSECG